MDIKTLQKVYFVTTTISITCSLFILVTFIRHWKYLSTRKSGVEFIFYQSLCDLFFTTKFLIVAVMAIDRPAWFTESEDPDETAQSDNLCISLAAISQFFGTATVLWNTVILLRIFLSLKMINLSQNSKFRKFIQSNIPYHIFVWGVTAIVTLIPFLLGQFGPNNVGCWFKERYSITHLFFMSLPVIICIFSSVILLGLIMYYKKKLIGEFVVHLPTAARSQKEAHFDILLIVYTLVFMGCWIPPVIVEYCRFFGYKSVVLVLLDAITFTLQGCGNAIVWVSLSSAIQTAIKNPLQQIQHNVNTEQLSNQEED